MNSTSVPLITTVPPTGLLTAVIVSVWPFSLAGPLESFVSNEANEIVRTPLSSATLDSESFAPVGASLISVTVKETLAMLVLKSSLPLVVPLSLSVYVKLAAPLK